MSIHFGLDARGGLLRGALIACKAIGATFGPLGSIAALDRVQGILHTKDGATVAREISLPDPVENQGAQLVKSACNEVDRQTGDGTTTTAVLIGALLFEVFRLIEGGIDPSELAEDLQQAGTDARWFLREMSFPLEGAEEIRRVAYLASNGDEELSRFLGEAVLAAGKTGTVLIEDSNKSESFLDFQAGMTLPTKLPILWQDRSVTDLEDCLVAVIKTPLLYTADVVRLLEEASTLRPSDGSKPDPLLIFAPIIDGDALRTLYLNISQGGALYFPLLTPHLGPNRELVGDIAAFAGARLVDKDAGMSLTNFDRAWFGSVRTAQIRAERAILTPYEEAQPAIDQRVRVLRALKAAASSDYDKDQLDTRIGNLTGSVCKIRIGGYTEAALKERRGRAEDALKAVQAALSDGLVIGGGLSYLMAADGLRRHSDGLGYKALAKALEAPIVKLTRDPGMPARVYHQWETSPDMWKGLDLATGQFRDLDEDPMVVDPALVMIAALEAAVSIAVTLLRAEVVVCAKRTKRR